MQSLKKIHAWAQMQVPLWPKMAISLFKAYFVGHFWLP